jgi:hypothetical protein
MHEVGYLPELYEDARPEKYFKKLCDISFEEYLPEDGHNRWPKHVTGYAIFNAINLHICVCCNGWSYFS